MIIAKEFGCKITTETLSIVVHSVELNINNMRNACKSLRRNNRIPVANQTVVGCTRQYCSILPSTRPVHHSLGQWIIEV